MTLAKQQWLFLGLALALLVALASVLLLNHLSVARSLNDLTQAQELIRTVVRMRNIAVEVTTERTERQIQQWQAGMREFAHSLTPMRTAFPDEIALMRAIEKNVEDADQLFQHLLASFASQQSRPSSNVDARLVSARIASALHVVLGDVSLMALRLGEMQTTEVRAARQNVLFTSVLLCLAILAILVTYQVIFRKLVLAPIKLLQLATDRIASGDLEHRVNMRTGNEFGELGERFDHMAEELQAARTRMGSAIKELEAFAYSVSHDLRAPLRGMDAFSRILLERYASHMEEDASHCLQMIRDNALQMGHLIDDLLAFSRLNQQPLKKELVQHEELVRVVLRDLEKERNNRQIEVIVGALPAAEADPRLLKQVWANLIENALKYTGSRERAVIRIDAKSEDGVPVYFVQDNGVGFDMRYAHKLFGVFQRLHRAEEYGGTGVGLAIVQRIIARHGGRVWAQAVKNEGATFYFTLQEAKDHAEQRG